MVTVHLYNKAANKYLAGHYQSGTTSLKNRDAPGARWEMAHLGSGQFTFLNLQDLNLLDIADVVQSFSEKRYLDGNTATGTVQLVQHIGEPFTGTKWLRSPIENSVVFTCLGVAHGNRMLDGRPGADTVQLMDHAGWAGTRWAIETPT
ncbi:hypothetical protein [Streptomyces sp. NPDC050585]|uniref:hypothetical protein n=1 Tax=unclassified Streptomyces TaxID=2593676 RepID=UPI00378F6618